MQAMLDDDQDPWTICQCSAADLVSNYKIPMGTAVRLLHSMRVNAGKDAMGKGSLVQRKSSNRVVAHHVATAILSLLEVSCMLLTHGACGSALSPVLRPTFLPAPPDTCCRLHATKGMG